MLITELVLHLTACIAWATRIPASYHGIANKSVYRRRLIMILILITQVNE